MLRAPQRVVRGAVSRQVMDSFHSDPVLKGKGNVGLLCKLTPPPTCPLDPSVTGLTLQEPVP